MLDALLPKIRQNILALLLGRPEGNFYLREIVRATEGGRGAVARELRSLAAEGIIIREKRGNLIYYHANKDCPIYPELQGLMLKTAGLVDILRKSLGKLKDIQLAFIFGSMAAGTSDVSSDIDLLVVTDMPFGDISSAFLPAQKRLNREIALTVYSLEEFHEKRTAKNRFLMRVLQGPKIMLVGNIDDLV